MPPNIQINWIMRFFRAKPKQYFGNKMQDCKKGSGFQFIKLDFVTDGQEIKLAILVNSTFLGVILSL